MSNAILRGREPELLARASLGGKSLEWRRGDNAAERERERKREWSGNNRLGVSSLVRARSEWA